MMGYFNEGPELGRYRRNRGNRGGMLMASLMGAVIGAMIVAIAIPALAINGLLPYKVQPNSAQAPDPSGNQKAAVEQVSVHINTDSTAAVQKTEDAVVGITNLQASTTIWSTNSSAAQPADTGSGIIYKKDGNTAYIVTNNHVVAGASKLEVSLNDGTKIPAKLLGSDIWTDLAVLRVDGSKVKKIAEFGDSDALKLGEPVIAIGNPLGPTFSGSVTEGVISGLKRTIPVDINQDGVMDWEAEVLQTDAAINPGNSGGALINLDGQVVGINSMKIAQQSVEGIGLSIPINSAKPIINDLEKYGTVKRPYLGVDLKSVSEIPGYYQKQTLKLPRDINYGAALRQVVPGSPAAKAGLKSMDVIVELDGDKINDVIDLRKHLYVKGKIGQKMKVKFYRGGKLQETTVTLGADGKQ